jgi:uncharacterized protein (DUF4213/DUF364 family)
MKTITITIGPTAQVLAGLTAVAGVTVLAASQAPEIQRYLKVRSM